MSLARFAFLSSVSALGLGAISTVLRGEPGWLWLAVLAFVIGGVLFLGVYFPWLQMFGPIVCRTQPSLPQLGLTFDDGPHPVTTRQVLSLLAPTRHRATFFVVGEKVEQHPDVVREIHEAGHAVALHGYFHDRFHFARSASRVAQELKRAADAVEKACGLRPRWYRPPVGQTSPLTVLGVRRAGCELIGWSGRAYDGVRSSTPESVLRNLTSQLEPGALLVLHDAAERDNYEPASVRALPALLRELDARGLTSVRLETLLEEARPAPALPQRVSPPSA